MSVDSAVYAGRMAAEARMQSRVTVMRKTGDVDPVEDNGYETPEWASVYIDLPFRSTGAGTGDGGSRGVEIGGVRFEDATGIGSVPAATLDLQDDDLLLVTSGEWADDVFRVVAAVRYDQKTARRLPIVEEPRPEEWA